MPDKENEKVQGDSRHSEISACPEYEGSDVLRKIADHPCYDPKAQHKYGRIHLPVAPACNIQCRFCVREYDCVNESRPGVTSEVLTPQEAVSKLRNVLSEHPYIKVVGIAGPGDPLANDETFETLELVKKEFPDLLLCMSTNGLALPDRVDDLVRLDISTLTVTVNAVDPKIMEKIYSHIVHEGKIYKGPEAAKILHRRQMEGIRAAVDAGIVVKINTVLIPTINDDHVVDIARRMSEMGVYIMNIIPMIPQGEFSSLRAPTTEERAKAQKACEEFVSQMKHCRQCRADAYGLLGKDLSQVSEERRRLIRLKRDS
ncbi:Radical SAM domain protein [Methanosalsum zhilinae DSM 4017]|uniref:FeMo cofactor biosynthesis protein NifB n=1 Tax=Methanosalsum zhilinae (strain DSM 4017 / NBRC 107636 / OCM 62 / WeN5) TaxID=679901 RepID=F7XPI1_METZD|nr:nitrogenase cofactor biosynthesis protein NifB [Methanosalsum zhilinae]AEH61406.1 Radical SAM domain protein [Methanosalsum zhilinae DSM 4017]